jgi:hypothetical protein
LIWQWRTKKRPNNALPWTICCPHDAAAAKHIERSAVSLVHLSSWIKHFHHNHAAKFPQCAFLWFLSTPTAVATGDSRWHGIMTVGMIMPLWLAPCNGDWREQSLKNGKVLSAKLFNVPHWFGFVTTASTSRSPVSTSTFLECWLSLAASSS